MAVTITTADAYIHANVIDNEDWQESDTPRKQRILNVANSTLSKRYSKYVIPDNAVYEFAAVLAAVFNDTNKMQQYGVTQFTMKGFSVSFGGSPKGSVSAFIPSSALDIIGEENGVNLQFRRVGRSVR